jgi:hypothetical protein
MVWMELKGITSSVYLDVTKICAVTGRLEEKASSKENDEYILEGTINLYSCMNVPLPIKSWDYNMGIPKNKKKIKNPEKQKEEIDKWKEKAFHEAKFKHDKRVLRVTICLEKLRNVKEKHVAFNFMNFLNSIDSGNLQL